LGILGADDLLGDLGPEVGVRLGDFEVWSWVAMRRLLRARPDFSRH
jgi:hypothetical protein